MKPVVDAATLRRLSERSKGAVEYQGLDGVAAAGVLRPVSALRWAVLARMAAGDAYGQIIHLRNVTLLIVAGLLVGVGLLAYFLGLLITRPLDRLTDGAAKVAAGDPPVDLPLPERGEARYLTPRLYHLRAALRARRP